MLVSLLLASTLALAASPAELARVRYLSNDGRRDEALQLGAKLIAADPDDINAHLTWIQARSWRVPDPRVLAIYEAWVADEPDSSVARVALAWATLLAAPRPPGPACDEVLALLEPLPEAGPVRARALWLSQHTLERCDRDDSEARAELITIAETEPRVRYAAVRLRLEDGVDEDDTRAVGELLEVEPWRLAILARLWSDESEGPGLEAAQTVTLEAAKAAAASDDPVLVDAAATIYRRAEMVDEAAACRERMEDLDPDHFMPKFVRDAVSGSREKAKLGTLDVRLAELGTHPPRGGSAWERGGWHVERAKLLKGLGRADEALDERRRAYKVHPGWAVNLAFGRAALEQDDQLRKARKALDVAVSAYGDIRSSGTDWESTRTWQQEGLVGALALRAEVNRRLGERRDARRDASRALLMTEDPTAHLVLGLCTKDSEYMAGSSFGHLSAGLAAGGSGFTKLDDEAQRALETAWPDQGWWIPGGLEAWLALEVEQSPAGHDDGDDVAERGPFPDLALELDGEPRLLSSFDGPVVVDLWATWCGPCRKALPQLDLLARTNPGITFLAVSVDEQPEDAGEYLSETIPAFVQVWGGPDAMKAAGVTGIPAVFFLDSDHRIVATEGGWSSDGGGLEEGVRLLMEAIDDDAKEH